MCSTPLSWDTTHAWAHQRCSMLVQDAGTRHRRLMNTSPMIFAMLHRNHTLGAVSGGYKCASVGVTQPGSSLWQTCDNAQWHIRNQSSSDTSAVQLWLQPGGSVPAKGSAMASPLQARVLELVPLRKLFKCLDRFTDARSWSHNTSILPVVGVHVTSRSCSPRLSYFVGRGQDRLVRTSRAASSEIDISQQINEASADVDQDQPSKIGQARPSPAAHTLIHSGIVLYGMSRGGVSSQVLCVSYHNASSYNSMYILFLDLWTA